MVVHTPHTKICHPRVPSVRTFHIARVSVHMQGRNSFFDWLAVKVWIATCIMVACTAHTEIRHPSVPSVQIFHIACVSVHTQGRNSLWLIGNKSYTWLLLLFQIK